MESNNPDINNTENKEENTSQNKDTIPTRQDSLNMNDNESHKILNKEDHLSESSNLNLESKTSMGKETSNSDKYHDKDTTEDSIIYFTIKLQKSNKHYKFILYISILLYIIDIFVYYKGDEFIHRYLNLVTILALLISSLHQAFSFRHDLKNISKELYVYTKKILYLFIIIFLAYIYNMIDILLFELNDMIRNQYVFYDRTKDNIIILTYIFINFTIPSLHVMKFKEVKKGIKDLSSAKGEDFEGDNAGDVEITNTVINDI